SRISAALPDRSPTVGFTCSSAIFMSWYARWALTTTVPHDEASGHPGAELARRRRHGAARDSRRPPCGAEGQDGRGGARVGCAALLARSGRRRNDRVVEAGVNRRRHALGGDWRRARG